MTVPTTKDPMKEPLTTQEFLDLLDPNTRRRLDDLRATTGVCAGRTLAHCIATYPLGDDHPNRFVPVPVYLEVGGTYVSGDFFPVLDHVEVQSGALRHRILADLSAGAQEVYEALGVAVPASGLDGWSVWRVGPSGISLREFCATGAGATDDSVTDAADGGGADV